MGDLITTNELISRADLTRTQLNWRRRRFPDRVFPARRIGGVLLWRPELVEVLMGLPVGRAHKV
jgi:hypothetical protein